LKFKICLAKSKIHHRVLSMSSLVAIIVRFDAEMLWLLAWYASSAGF